MANICDNSFYFRCEKGFQKYENIFEKLFEETLDGEITFCYSDSESDPISGIYR